MFRNPIFLSIIGIIVASISIYADWGKETWEWFQRSGSFLVLIGAVMELRSVLRLGVKGIGGANTSMLRGKLEEVDDSGSVQKINCKYDDATTEYLYQAKLDEISGFCGALFLVCGTIIWGYGDLAGILF